MRTIPSLAGLLVLVLVLVPTLARAQGTLSFTDVTAAAGVTNSYFSGLFAHFEYTAGGAVGDFDQDGWPDVYVVTGGVGGNPDRLFMNNGDGTFTDEAAAWGLTEIHMGKGVSVADFNNDGFEDIYVTSAGPITDDMTGQHKLYRNNGNGTFTNIAAMAGVAFTTISSEDGFGSAWTDYDLDGDLDLFVAGFENNNEGNVLFRNNGDETFTNVTAVSELFLGSTIHHRGFAPRFMDVDGDRYPEFLLVSDFGTSIYWKNDGDGTFTEWTTESGMGLEENGMGQCIGDFDRDGLLDWYVASIFRPAIGWTGNKLYLTQPDATYVETSVAAGVEDGGYGWACIGVDLDHDGWTDIVETNGGISSEFTGEPSYLWINDGDGTFTENAIALGFDHDEQGRGMVRLDYDLDGDQDIMIFANNAPLQFFRNDLSGPDTHWLRIILDNGPSTTIPPHGIGAKITISADGVTQVSTIDGGDHFCSHGELTAHFGLAGATLVDTVDVEWTDGSVTSLTAVAVDRTITIFAEEPIDPDFLRGDVNADGGVNIADAVSILSGLFGTPGAILCAAAADSNDDGGQDIGDAVYVLSYTFSGGAAPPAPFPDCGLVVSPFDCVNSACP
ncbi:MAG: FG-GAP-like repeat-containing protein [Planctomycetota bacterium]